MAKQEVKDIKEAKKRIEEVLKKEKKVSPPVDVIPRNSGRRT